MVERADPRIGAVVITRNRPHVVDAIEGLLQLPSHPEIVVVDNASTDGTPEAIAERFPDIRLLRLSSNHGGAARNAGVAAVDRPYVAFCDDDVFWEPGALRCGADLMDGHARLGLIAAKVLVGRRDALDPTCDEMARSPLPRDPALPGVPVLGFIAGAAMVRRCAFLAVGGFERRYVVGGEEQLLALQLIEAGWALAYVDSMVAHHHPSAFRTSDRLWIQRRNALWTAWLRRSAPRAVEETVALLRASIGDPVARRALVEAARGGRWALRNRRTLPPALERYVSLLD